MLSIKVISKVILWTLAHVSYFCLQLRHKGVWILNWILYKVILKVIEWNRLSQYRCVRCAGAGLSVRTITAECRRAALAFGARALLAYNRFIVYFNTPCYCPMDLYSIFKQSTPIITRFNVLINPLQKEI